MGHDEIMVPVQDAPSYLVGIAQQRAPLPAVRLAINNLVMAGQNNGDAVGRQETAEGGPGRMLVGQGRVAYAAHKRRDEASVVRDHPADVLVDAAREVFCRGIAVRTLGLRGSHVGNLGGRNRRRDFVLDRLWPEPPRGCGDGTLETGFGGEGEEALGDEAGAEGEAGDGTKVGGADETGGCQEHEGGGETGKRGGERGGEGTAEGVAYQVEGVVACPGQRGGGEGEEDVGGVEAIIVGQVADAIRETPAEEVKDEDAAAFVGQGTSEWREGDAGCRDAVDEEDLGAVDVAPFVYADGAVLLTSR